jgi:hypothetical protein
MIAPKNSHMTLDEAVLDYAQQATAPFSAEDALPAILGKLADPPSDAWMAIEIELDECEWLFCDEQTGLYTPRHIFFAGTQFLIVPQPDEIEQGILIPGHRFIPFLAQDIFPTQCRLVFADGTTVATKQISRPIKDLLLYLTFFGPQGALAYVTGDDSRNGRILKQEADTHQRFTVTAFDMADVYARHHVAAGDAFQCTVTDWARGHYTLEHIPAARRQGKRAVTKWVNQLEEALYATGEYLNEYDNVSDQLALALFVGPPMLRQAPPTHFGGFLNNSRDFAVQETPFAVMLRAPDDDIGDLFENAMAEMDLPTATGRCDSLAAILGEAGLTITDDEIEAYMRDEWSRGNRELGPVMDRVLAGRYGLEFYDERQAAAFQAHLDTLWQRVQSDFDPKHDKRIAPLRARILNMTDQQVAWLRDCDRLELAPSELPHEQSVELASIGSILSQVLGLLNRDQKASAKDIRALEDTIKNIEDISDNLLAQLRTITHPPAKPNLRVLHPDAPPASDQVYQLKVTLKNIRPPIWRRLLVPSTATLAELHRIIQSAMGWEDGHLHGFEIDGKQFQPASDEDGIFAFDGPDTDTTVPLRDVVRGEGSKFSYTYDFGDTWEHVILVEKVLPVEAGVTYPRCIKGKRACPPEDCGGPWGYGHLLEVLANPGDPEYEEMTEWMPPDFDPETFALKAINTRLAHT